MNAKYICGASLLGLGIVLTATPGFARPEIASGDRLLNTSFDGCMDRAASLVESLGVQSDSGNIDHTGYFEDGTFRILCYGTGEESMAVIFASHDDSIDVATNFVQMALDKMSEADATALPESDSAPPSSTPVEN